jgi:hypothetical protein
MDDRFRFAICDNKRIQGPKNRSQSRENPSMPLVYALVCFLLLVMPIEAQIKRDIHGFATGMSTSQVTAHGKGRCSATFSCKVDGGDLHVWFQSHARPKLVTRIVFTIESGTGPEEMAPLVARQFGGQLVKVGTGFFDSSSIYVGRRMSLKVIAKWDLGDQLYLSLGFSAGTVNRYALELRSDKLESLDAKAKIAGEEAAKAKLKATNPSPKF